MLSIFRRFTNSRIGVIVTFGVLGVIALAFAAGDVTGLRSGDGSVLSGSVARVGDANVTPNDLRSLATNEIEGYRQRQPGFDARQYVAAGGLNAALDRLVSGLALQQFGQGNGVVVSKRSVDGQIASLPGLRGPTGQFDQAVYEQVLAQRRLTDAQVRGDIAREIAAQRLIAPQQGAGFVPRQVALPYASLLLERRAGEIVSVPNSAVPAGPAPTDAEVQRFYAANRARYTVPERRVVRYALMTPTQVAAQAVPSDAEVQRAFAADQAKYAPSQRRTVAQVIVADRAGADALVAAVRGGRSIADAARAAGLEASTQTGVDKAAYAGTAGQPVADAVFAAAQGAVVGPIRGTLGYVVARVERVEQVAGRTLAQARPEIVAALTKQKTADALNRTRDAAEDQLGNNATFDEVVADRKLSPVTSRPLLANGTDPDRPAEAPVPALLPIVQTVYSMEEGDDPQIVATGPDGGFALVALGSVVQAAPRPLAQIRDRVAADFAADRTRTAARRVAAQLVARAGGAASLGQAAAGVGVRLPAVRAVNASRSELAANPRGAEPALALMFAMAPGTAKLLEAPDRSGWQVVTLRAIQPGNAAANAGLIAAVRADLGRAVGAEYAEQFARAARAAVGARVDQAAVARVRQDLTGQGRGD